MKGFFSKSFRHRLTAAFLVASLIPLLICSVSLVQIARLRVNNQTVEAAEDMAANISLAMDRLNSGLVHAAQVIGADPLVETSLQNFQKVTDTQVYGRLFSATQDARSWAGFSLYDSAGNLRYSTGTAGEPNLPTSWGLLHAAGQTPGEPVYQPCETGDTRLQGAVALLSGNKTIGYLVMELDDKSFPVLFEGSYGAQCNILILSRFWHPIYSSQPPLRDTLAPQLRQELLSHRPLGETDDEFLYTVLHHPATGLYLVLQQPHMFTRSTLRLLYTASASGALLCVLLSIVMSFGLGQRISSPVQKLQTAISKVSRDDLEVQIPVESDDELGMLAQGFNRMVGDLKQNRQALVENQRELNQAQIRMLQAQLNPHFLCNTLDTMKWISKINKLPQVALMSTDLADILRFCISPEEFVPLRREAAVLERYIEIQKIRLSGSFVFSLSLPEELEDCLVPKMILQPIVENAILHGLSGVENSRIQVAITQKGDALHCSVTDNGAGFPEDMVGKPYHREVPLADGHLGLYNVDTILTKYYGRSSGLWIDRGENGVGAQVVFQLPIRKGEAK